MIDSIGQGYPTQAIQTAYGSNKSIVDQPPSGQSGDTVSISDEAVLMSKTTSNPSSSRLLDPLPLLTPEELDKLTEDVQDRITALLLENDISTNPPVEVTTDAQGALRVKGDHPDKDKIERLLAEDSKLSNDFREVSAQTFLQEALAEHQEFVKAYEKDPYAALIQYGHLFDKIPNEPYSMTIGANHKA